MTNSKSFYSERAIYIGTYLGGPLAAGYLIQKNYQVMEEEAKGKKAFFIGLISTLLMVATLLLLPESIIDKIPNLVVPGIYTLATYLIVQKIQAPRLAAHKESGGEFYSVWRAVGLSLIALCIYLLLAFSSAFLIGDFDFSEPTYNTTLYEQEMTTFIENEEKAIEVFDEIEIMPNDYLVKEFIKSTVIWEENKTILNRVKALEGIEQDILDYNVLLSRYVDLRIKHNRLIAKALSEDTDLYDPEIEKAWLAIEQVIEEMN